MYIVIFHECYACPVGMIATVIKHLIIYKTEYILIKNLISILLYNY